MTAMLEQWRGLHLIGSQWITQQLHMKIINTTRYMHGTLQHG